MIVILGLIVLIAAVLIGLAGVLANGGSAHALTDNFAVFGYHVTGSTGVLFLYGIVVGGVGLAGLGILLGSSRRTARRGADARRELNSVRRDIPAPGAVARRPDRQQHLTAKISAPTQYPHPGTTNAAIDEPGSAAGKGIGPNTTKEPR
ncbi:hypothetical protein [Nocardia sp. SYP-A9097]|uniref:hypothetical protein n=1 Tax=Nocardia sp. SYP-A9097 TaxID=2663237 RepID=UPI001891F27A|nr:hypothetical protein [Nocardia sp. SYP-A9097]